MKVPQIDRAQAPDTLRQFAEQLDAFVEADLAAVTAWSPATIASYRKRGVIEAIKIGRHYIYPKRQFIEPRRINTRGLL